MCNESVMTDIPKLGFSGQQQQQLDTDTVARIFITSVASSDLILM